MIRKILVEVSPFLLLAAAVILGVIALPLGVIHRVIKLFYDSKGTPRKERFKKIGRWILEILYQVWVVVKYVIYQVAYVIDLLGNVISGEAIEDIITAKENTLLGRGDVSISAAIGDLKRDPKALNGRGRFLDNILRKLDYAHEDHCDASIRLLEFKKSLRNDAN